jgi:alpha-glucosidase
VWTGGNHDNHRFATRWGQNDPARARTALVMLMGLRGTPFLYYGDEIGMPDTNVPKDRILDPVGVFHGARMGRDDERTPMHWSPAPGADFSAPGVEPWLPYGDYAACNVADQRTDPDSTLSLTRDLIGLRDALPELRTGTYKTLAAPNDDVWAWQRGERTVIACNLSDESVEVAGVGTGAIRISTIRSRDNESVAGTLTLAPWEAVIVWRES